MRGHLAVEDVAVFRVDARAVERNPEGDAVGVGLLADRLEDIIAAPERHGAAERLQVVPPAAAGAGVDEHVRMPPAQLVPVGEIALDVADSR